MHPHAPFSRPFVRSFTAIARLLSACTAVWLVTGALGLAYADDYTVSDDTNVTNGDANHVLGDDDSLTITQSGSITTTGDQEDGVYADGDRNVISNRGKILTSGTETYGIYVTGNGNSVTNWGGITTSGSGQSHGIFVQGDNNVLTNWGRISITTELNEGAGIQVFGTGNDITNWGDILTRSVDAMGIEVGLDGNTVTNRGTITTSGNLAFGISLLTPDNTAVNWGRISTTGLAATGIRTNQGGNTVANWGAIYTEGETAPAILVFDGNNTVTNGGKLMSRRSYSIILVGNGDTLNLLAPSYLGGGIDLGAGTQVNLTTGPSHSVLWKFEGTMDGGVPTMSGPYAGFYNEQTMEYATFDPTVLAGNVNQLGDMQGLLSSIGRSGLTRGDSAPVQIADSTGQTVGGGGGVLPWDGRVWAGGFGGFYDHDGDSGTLGRDIDVKGFAVGYSARPWAGLTVSAMAGYLRGRQKADSRWASSYRLDSDGVFAGANGRFRFGPYMVDLGLVAGRLSYDSDRFVNDNMAPQGASWASASYDGWFVSPEIGLSAPFDWTDVVTVRPAARVGYAHQRIGSYHESGSNADARVDGQHLSLLIATAEVGFEKRLFDAVTVNAVCGYARRVNIGDDSVSVELIDVTNEVDIGDADSGGFFAGGGLSVDVGGHVGLALEARTYLSGDISGTEGHATLSVVF